MTDDQSTLYAGANRDSGIKAVGSMLMGDPRAQLAERVAASAHLSKAPKLRAFFQYIVSCYLEDRTDQVNERQIGVAVFDREPGYSSGDDNIVRAQARLLRTRLRDYFANEGRGEAFVIEIPKGGYVPVFHSRLEQKPTLQPDVGGSEREEERNTIPTSSRRVVAVGVLAGICGLTAGWMLRGSASTEEGRTLRRLPQGFQLFWEPFFASGKDLMLVAPDVGLGLTSEFLGRDYTLGDYLLQRHWNDWDLHPAMAGTKPDFPRRNYTMLEATSLAAKVGQFAGLRQRGVSIRDARNVSRRDFSDGPAIVVGTPVNQPWLELFAPRMNFHFESNAGQRPSALRNRRPKPDEPSVFHRTASAGMIEGYATVSFRTGIEGKAGVLLLSGMSMEVAEAAADLLLQPALFEKHIAPKRLPTEPYFEFVVRTKNRAGISTPPSIVAWRSYTD
jgi:hypothetical protein